MFLYLHLGQAVVVTQKSVLGIFDMDNTTASPRTRDFLSRAEKDGRVIDISGDLPASFVLCDDGVYLSQLATATLLRRSESNSFE
ncbi:MAG: DUF370 domain-containing protein [Oscillospiraceae bacterium]